jgi:hypothetical protein
LGGKFYTSYKMKTLVFVLMIQTISNGYVESAKEYAFFRDLNRCIYFSELIAKQIRFNEYLPVTAYCVTKWVDPEDTVIFE